MSFPGVSVGVSKGNLLRSIAVLDGIGAIVATAAVAGNIGKVQQVYSLTDAVAKGYTEAAEPFLYGLLKEFYGEIGGNQLLYVMGVAETVTMEDVVDSTNNSGLVKLLTAAAGEINLVAVARKPAVGYSAGAGFLDTDVEAALLQSKTLCEAWQAKNSPIRIFIEGRVANRTVANTFKPNEASNGYAGVVLGGTSDNGSASVGLALARACKYAAHIKLGSGQNGALTANQIYIGTDKIEDRLDMATLHDAGFITFHRRPGAAGYYFGRDNMASADDFNILVHGRVIDKAQRITAKAYLPYVEDYIRINSDGTLNETDTRYLEDVLKAAIKANMGEQISDVNVVIDSAQSIVGTSTLEVGVQVLPLGYLTWINVTMGLTAQTTTA